MMLVALALLRPEGGPQGANILQAAAVEEDSSTPQDAVFKVTAAIAPVLLPLIEHLGTLNEEDISEGD